MPDRIVGEIPQSAREGIRASLREKGGTLGFDLRVATATDRGPMRETPNDIRIPPTRLADVIRALQEARRLAQVLQQREARGDGIRQEPQTTDISFLVEPSRGKFQSCITFERAHRAGNRRAAFIGLANARNGINFHLQVALGFAGARLAATPMLQGSPGPNNSFRRAFRSAETARRNQQSSSLFPI